MHMNEWSSINGSLIARLVHEDPEYFAHKLGVSTVGRPDQIERICYACLEKLNFSIVQINYLHGKIEKPQSPVVTTVPSKIDSTKIQKQPIVSEVTQNIEVSKKNTPPLQFDLEIDKNA